MNPRVTARWQQILRKQTVIWTDRETRSDERTDRETRSDESDEVEITENIKHKGIFRSKKLKLHVVFLRNKYFTYNFEMS